MIGDFCPFQFKYRNQNSFLHPNVSKTDRFGGFDFKKRWRSSHPYGDRRKHQRRIGIEKKEMKKTLELEFAGGAKARVSLQVQRRTSESSFAESSMDSSLWCVCKWSWRRLRAIPKRDPKRRNPKFQRYEEERWSRARNGVEWEERSDKCGASFEWNENQLEFFGKRRREDKDLGEN